MTIHRCWLAGILFPILALQPRAIAMDKTSVAILTGDLDAPARHGVSKLVDALGARGFDVAQGAGNAAANFIVLAGVDCPPVNGGAEALTIRRTTRGGRSAIALCGADARGVMYAALEVAETVAAAADPRDPFAGVQDRTEKPFLTERGVSMYTMHRAYFESRLFDERYWQRYFDMLAANRINNFVVIFGYENGGFMAPPYPYFFDVAEFPDVTLVGLTKDQQARNTAAFKTMIRLAHERGIAVTAGIWDHIYRGGVQAGGIPGAPKSADARTPGLVWGVTGDNLAAYTKAALRTFLEVFPDIDAIQFRMHEESGLTQKEMVGFWHEVFALIRATRPSLRLDLRAKGLPDAVIDDALAQGLDARVSTKFWMEQMGLPFHPTHVNPQNQKDRRHGYADLLRYPQRYRVHWQVWSGGTTRLLLWGDPDYVRRFAGIARTYGGNSFEINEMLATKMLGEPHNGRPIEILNPRDRYYDYEFERYWHFYQLWGRLTYDPQASSDIWEREFGKRFGNAAPHVMDALHSASRVLPRIVAASYRYAYFPTTRGWAEMMRQGDLPAFAGAEGSDTQQFMNPRDEAKSILDGTATAMRRPEETARWFAQTADRVTAELALAEKAAGHHASNEFRSTATDLRIVSGLARYYAARLPAAVWYNVYKQCGDPSALDKAIEEEKHAVDAWASIVRAAGDVYSETLPFGAPGYFPRHWKEELERLRKDLDALVDGRKSLAARSDVKWSYAEDRRNLPPPVVTLSPVPPAAPGNDVVISARVNATAPIAWMRLRYRHLTQFEDYSSADMTLDASTGLYTARIPASFIDPKWDLMYFVEAVDKNGNGRMYPDLEVETPYVIIPVQRDSESGFTPLFNGKDLTGWVYGTRANGTENRSGQGYQVEDGVLFSTKEDGGNLFTEKEYSDFAFRFEFKLTENANNGIGIRAPLQGDAAYAGIEIQVLDDSGSQYTKLQPWQYHGSVYGVVPSKRGFQKPVGEWNSEEIVARGRHITVILNGTTIVDTNLDDVKDQDVIAKHPGLARTSGHIGFLGHGARVEFRNIRIKDLSAGGAAAQGSWRAKPDVVASTTKRLPQFNFDESAVKPYELPDVMKGRKGPVRSQQDWKTRRAEIMELYRANVYGRSPAKPDTLRFEVVEENRDAMEGKATLRRVAIHSTQKGRAHRFELTMFLPNGARGRVPMFLLINLGRPNQPDMPRGVTAAAAELIPRGYGLASIQNGELAPDDKDHFREGVLQLFEGTATGERAPDAWAALAAWGWGASRAMDYLETDPVVDASHVAVVGHSRGGKAALWAGAEDERFAMVISNESGEGGAALTRRNFGETLQRITTNFPHWFAPRYATFAGREQELPVDQHMLLATIAPRALYVASADEDLWSDPRGEYLSIVLTSPVYALWKEPKLLDEMPALEQPIVAGRRGYHIRTGAHALAPYDWQRYMDFADAVWHSKTGSR